MEHDHPHARQRCPGHFGQHPPLRPPPERARLPAHRQLRAHAETLSDAQNVLDFCVEQKVLASFSPQAVCNWPRYELLVSEPYAAFVAQLVAIKRRGGPILGSLAYLRTLQDLRPYACYPTLTPRILPGGELAIPAAPSKKLAAATAASRATCWRWNHWSTPLRSPQANMGPPPRVCTSCFQQCFADPSLMQAHPLALLNEWLFYPPSRQAGLASYAPG